MEDFKQTLDKQRFLAKNRGYNYKITNTYQVCMLMSDLQKKRARSSHLIQMQQENKNDNIQPDNQLVDKKQIISSDSDKTSSTNDHEQDENLILNKQHTSYLQRYKDIIQEDRNMYLQLCIDLISNFLNGFLTRTKVQNIFLFNITILKTRKQKQLIYQLVISLYNYFISDSSTYNQMHYCKIMNYLMKQNDDFLISIKQQLNIQDIQQLSNHIKGHIFFSQCKCMDDFRINHFISMFTHYKFYRQIDFSKSEQDNTKFIKQIMQDVSIYNCIIFDIISKDYLLALSDNDTNKIQYAYEPNSLVYNQSQSYDVVGFFRELSKITLPDKIRALHIISIKPYFTLPIFSPENLTILTLGHCVCPDISKCKNLKWMILDGIKEFQTKYLINLSQLERIVFSRITFHKVKNCSFKQQNMQMLLTLFTLENIQQIHLEFIQIDETVQIQCKLKHLQILYIQRASLKKLILNFELCQFPKLELIDIENAILQVIGDAKFPRLYFIQCSNKDDILKMLK